MRKETDMYFVYRYIANRGQRKILYVGITNNMDKRVKEHESDKLKVLRWSADIQYFAVNSRFDADALETYLIGQYRPPYNTAKKRMDTEQPSFLGDIIDSIEWCNYQGYGCEICKDIFEVKSHDYITREEMKKRATMVFYNALERNAVTA